MIKIALTKQKGEEGNTTSVFNMGASLTSPTKHMHER